MLISAKEAKKQAEINAYNLLALEINNAILDGQTSVEISIKLLSNEKKSELTDLGYSIRLTRYDTAYLISWY